MGRRLAKDQARVTHKVTAHLTPEKHKQLTDLLAKNPRLGMSRLLRDILDDRPIKLFIHDSTMDQWIEEVSKLRAEIRAIGINVNQITRYFNTYPEPARKITYAKMAFAEYILLQPKIEQILTIMKKLSEKWLPE